jgi:hypothetical protein
MPAVPFRSPERRRHGAWEFISTRVCDLLDCRYPIVLAGMGGVTRSELVAAITNCLSQFIARRWLTRYLQLLSEGIRSRGRRLRSAPFT